MHSYKARRYICDCGKGYWDKEFWFQDCTVEDLWRKRTRFTIYHFIES